VYVQGVSGVDIVLARVSLYLDGNSYSGTLPATVGDLALRLVVVLLLLRADAWDLAG
jgi:hypothetical protein